VNPFQILQQLLQACSLSQAELEGLLTDLGLESPPTVTQDTIDGQQVRRIQTGFLNQNDLSIPISTWKLRLVPTPVGSPGEVRVPIELVCNQNDNSAREVRVELARFELETDPDDLIAADLLSTPNTHLRPTVSATGQPVPVRLLGPGLTLIVRGPDLDDLDFDFGGATGGAEAAFPSARFEPPHFIIAHNGKPTDIGVVCDEILLDLKHDADPQVVQDKFPEAAGSFRGFHLKELGVYIGDGSEVGTWSGMAAMKDFFIELNPGKLTGTFIGELVRYVIERDPQVQVSVFYEDEDGSEIFVTNDADASIPAPPEGRDYVRVRLEARPNWDSAGFQVEWGVPPGVLLENTNRLTSLNLNWVRVPADGQQYSFTVTVHDHRIPTQVETRIVEVARRPLAGPTDRYIVHFDGVAENGDGFDSGSHERLHVALHPGQRILLTARVRGTVSAVNAQLREHPQNFFSIVRSAPDPGLEDLSAPPNLLQHIERLPDSQEFELAQWIVQVPNTTPPGNAVLILDVRDENVVQVSRRLRVMVVDPPSDNHRNFILTSYLDWLDAPGAASARLELTNGLAFGDIEWYLDFVPTDAGLFSDEGRDDLFAASFDLADPLPYLLRDRTSLSFSDGMVRPFLGERDHLWRLTGVVPPDAGAGTPRAPIVIGESVGAASLQDEVVRNFLGPLPPATPYTAANGVTVRPILFHYDCAEVQPQALDPVPTPVPRCYRTGPEHSSLRLGFAATNEEQAKGFAALFRAIEEFGDEIEAIGLFGAASSEGSLNYNLTLSRDRVNAVKTALIANPLPAALVTAMAALPGPDQYSVPADVLNRIASLNAAGGIVADAFGEKYAHTVVINQQTGQTSVDPNDRRVFAVLKLKPAVSDQQIIHQEYFLTLPGPTLPPQPLIPIKGELQEHPFRHSIFRMAHVEVEVLRNRLVRLQIRLKVDLEAFNENDIPSPEEVENRTLNDLDGVTTFFLEMKRNLDPGPLEPTYSWELTILSDPGDLDGFKVFKRPDNDEVLTDIGAPAVVLPALTALAGGRTGISAFIAGFAVGAILTDRGMMDVLIFVWRGIRFRLLHGNVQRPTISVAVDYTVKYHIDIDLGQIIPGLPRFKTDPERPLEVSFRNVGVEFRPGSLAVEFFYDPASGFQLDINDPGVFRLGDGIGRLLNVERFRTGAGSPLWFEVELSLALETGIFAVDTLRIRVSLDTDKLFEAQDGVVTLGQDSVQVQDFTVTMNKLGVSVDVPGTLEGRGALGIESGTVEGELDLDLVPLDLRIYGGLHLYTSGEFRSLFAQLGVEFSPGILLGSTGAAIYGFFGLVGVQMRRNNPQPLPWFLGSNPPATVGVTNTNKWTPSAGGWAFGVGSVIGTAFDNGFSFNTKGALLLEIPGPKLMLATESKFLSSKPAVGDAERGNLVSVVMLDLENRLLLIAIDFTYVVPNLIEFRVPAEIFFNLASANDWRIRFGQWEPAAKRITLRLLGLYNAWGYYVLEGDGSQIPGPLSLQGVSLATGSRIEIFWGSRDAGVYLEAFIEYHVGLQMRPLLLQGVLEVGGELHLIVATLGARGTLNVLAPSPFVLRGEICGKLDLWLFSIEGCATFTIGDGSAQTPDPPNPFQELTVIDRMTSAAVEDANAAPLDAVLHLVFDQDIIDRRNPPGLNLADPVALRQQVSEELFYDYYLQEVTLVRTDTGQPVDLIPDAPPGQLFQSAWGAYTLDGSSAAEADSARTLRLLDWIPHSHTRAVDFTGGYGETLRALFERICETAPRPEPGCATFDGQPLGVRDVWHLRDGKLEPVDVITSHGNGLGAEVAANVGGYTAASVAPLPPVVYPGRVAQKRSLRLPTPAENAREFLEEILGQLEELLIGNPGPEAAQFWEAGLLFISLPELVSADVTFVLPAELRRDGALVLLDRLFKPVTAIESLQNLPFVSGSSSTSPLFNAHVARRFSFDAPDDGEDDPARAAWLVIVPPGPQDIPLLDPFSYLTEICGIPFGEWEQWRDRVEGKAHTILELEGLLGVVGGVPAVSAQEVLDPGVTYQVQGTLHWARYRRANATEADGSGSFGINRTFRTVGVNDHPREIRRYVLDHNPPDDRQPHYYAEPVQIRFASDIIDRLYAKFGRQLVARAKADTGQHVLNQPLSEGAERQFFPLGSFEETLAEILVDLQGRCLPGAWEQLFPKFVYEFEPLTPNTGYTMTLIPRPLGEPTGLTAQEWDQILEEEFAQNRFVYRFDLRTSRWATFGEHVAGYRAYTVGDLIAGDEQALDDALSALTADRSDADVEQICLALFGGPLAIPDAPQVMRIWVATGPPPTPFSTPPYRCRGILLDGPEPLLKLRGDGSPSVEIEVRQAADETTDFTAGAPIAGYRAIAGARGARVFLLFDPPTPPAFAHVELRYHRDNGQPPLLEHLSMAIGETPGSFNEEGA
jgi:hypothetical protein